MGVLVPSLVLSLCAVCVTGAKLCMLAWRCYRGDDNMRIDFGLSYLLLVINILLLVFSIVRKEIALEVLLSLANGALILYQFMWAWQFSFLDLGLRKFIAVTQMLCVITVCVLSPVVPYALKKGQKGLHIAGLCFFAMEYVLLFIFYGHIFLTSYRKPKHGRQGEDKDKIHDIVVFNMVLSSSAFIVAIPSLVLYAKGVVNFELSLWMKYGVAAVWFVRWVLLQYTSKYNFNALWFWRWLQFTAANADSGIPSVATNEPLREGSVTFQFTATDADSKTPSFETNKAPHMGSEVNYHRQSTEIC